jgi:hypothetical protein
VCVSTDPAVRSEAWYLAPQRTNPHCSGGTGSFKSTHRPGFDHPITLSHLRSLLEMNFFRGEKLCDNCLDADFVEACRGGFVSYRSPDGPRNYIRRRSDPRSSWECGPELRFCVFCRLLSRLTAVVGRKPSKNESLEVFSKKPLLVHFDNYFDPDWGFEVREGGGQLAYDELAILPDDAYGQIKDRLLECMNHHQDSSQCSLSEVAVFTAPIRVIDCHSRSVITALKDCDYVALSYIWGNSSELSDASSFPRTIEDAVKVTLHLGFRYLWVDRYCISQEQSEKHAQIRQMDQIYKNAQVCLIAAAGTNPNDGLAGVSRMRSRPRVRTTTENLEFHLFPFDMTLVGAQRNCAWAQRGWTFQEALFSRRHVVFTDIEVVVNCGREWYREATRFSVREHLYRSEEYCWPPLKPMSNLAAFIGSYSGRQMSYPEDILLAFSGVFNAYATLIPEVRHLWGIPIFPDVQKSFEFGLFWQFESRMHHKNIRRIGFPSWSWAGWYSTITYGSASDLDKIFRCRRGDARTSDFTPTEHDSDVLQANGSATQIHVEDFEGKRLTLEDCWDILYSSEPSFLPFIIVCAWSISVDLVDLGGQYEPHARVVHEGIVIFQNGLDNYRRVFGDEIWANSADPLKCVGLVMGAKVLVLYNRGEYWERVGSFHCLKTLHSHCKMDDADFKELPWFKKQEYIRSWWSRVPKALLEFRIG